jgi:hypothetical protein
MYPCQQQHFVLRNTSRHHVSLWGGYTEILAREIGFDSSKTPLELRANLLLAVTKKESSVVTSHKLIVELKAGNNSSS